MMKKIILLLCMAISPIVFSQINTGKITYKYKYGGMTLENNFKNATVQNTMNDIYNLLLSYSGRINYTLSFNEHLSKYSIEHSLNSDGDKSIENAKKITGSREIIYTDTKNNYKLKEIEFLGDKLIVKDDLDKQWNLTQDRKKIGNYMCYKAWMRNDMGVLIEAWYTPEIPINLGPRGYGNLPGLILELKQASLLYIASEIILNPKNPSVIKIPNKRKFMTQKEFNDMVNNFDKKRQR